MNVIKRRDSLELTVFNSIARLGIARYTDLCAELPFARGSLTTALKRLKEKGFIVLKWDAKGDYWAVGGKQPVDIGGHLSEIAPAGGPARIQPLGAIPTPWAILGAWRSEPRLLRRR